MHTPLLTAKQADGTLWSLPRAKGIGNAVPASSDYRNVNIAGQVFIKPSPMLRLMGALGRPSATNRGLR